MTGTLRVLENLAYTWVKGTTLQHSIERFKKLGDVRKRTLDSGETVISVRRFDGTRIQAKFFPVSNPVEPLPVCAMDAHPKLAKVL